MSKAYDWINATHLDPEHMTWNVRWQLSGCQNMMPDANQRLPQHNADHVPVRTYKEISDTPEHVSFASYHQAACCMPIEATTAWYKVLDLESPIISWLYRTHTLWPRRHDKLPTIGPLEHNDKHGWSTSAQPTGHQRLINMDKPATYLVA